MVCAAPYGDSDIIETLEREGRTIHIVRYKDESQLSDLIRIMSEGLSETYGIYTYRYFIHGWPQYTFLAYLDGVMIGAVVSKTSMVNDYMRGYIAMLGVTSENRKYGIGSSLASLSIRELSQECDIVYLETEKINSSALRLYESMGFVRDKLLLSYYANGNDAYRLKLHVIKESH